MLRLAHGSRSCGADGPGSVGRVPDWPPIDDALLRRLALPMAELDREVYDYVGTWPSSEPDAAFRERALGYPWARPAGSFVLEHPGGLGPITPAHHEELATLAAGATPPGHPRRYPLLAIGSNGAPDTLIRKFEFLPHDARRVIVVAGRLHGFDVGATARIAPYGAFPATLVPSPGTAVYCSLLWVTEPQLLALTWSELSYAFGRLAPIVFQATDHPPHRLDHGLVYVSRWGHLELGGQPVALEAMAADHRRGAVWSQERLLEHAAVRLFGAGARAERLIEAVAREPLATVKRVASAVAVDAVPFEHPAWTPYPGSQAPD